MKASKENTRKESKKSTRKQSQAQSFNSNYQSTETIVKSILDKITILAFYEGFSKETDKDLGEFCYNHMKKEITSFFELNFINYTNSNNNNSGELLWEMTPQIENTWEEIFEPESEPIDRYESAQIKYQQVKRETNNIDNQKQEKEKMNVNNLNKKSSLKIKNKLSDNNKILNINQNQQNKNKKISDLNNNIISEVEEKSSMSGFEGEVKLDKGTMLEVSGIEDKFSESLNITDAEIKKNIDNVPEFLDDNKDKDINTNKLEEKIRKEEKMTTKKNVGLPPISNQKNDDFPQITKKNKYALIFSFPSVDIPGVEQEYNHHNLEPSNIDLLRQEREELIQKKLTELKTEKVINKLRKTNDNNDKRPKKIFDANHLTFDSNGNIINFHPYKLDKLKKEFAIIKNLIKGEPKPEIPKSKGKSSYTNIFSNRRQKESNKNADEEKKVKELIEKPAQNVEEKTTKEKERYVPSGSNFQIISPNIGVVIKENNKYKQGPKDFSKYFQKYSLNDYDKMLTDFVPLQNKSLIQNQLKKLNSSLNNDYISTVPNKSMNINSPLKKKATSNSLSNSYDFNNNANNNSNLNINNPLLTDATAMNNSNNNITTNINNNINSSLSNNPLLSSNFRMINSNNNIPSYKSINTERSIVMKKLGTTSLKLEIDSLKDLNTINPEILNRTNRVKNIFRYDSYKDYKRRRNRNENKISAFTEFNRNIMNSRDWGNEIGNKKTDNNDIGFNNDDNIKKYSRHVTKQQVLRELGSNILSGIKIRLPRDRKVDINSNI
jgi:hypothetical protein